MDRERLKEVHQTDLTESRVNVEFVDWLKTKGMTWLLVVLVALCAYLGYARWTHHKHLSRVDAWKALGEAQLPGSLQEVADEYDGIDAVAALARLTAAEKRLDSVLTGREPKAPTATPVQNNPMQPPPPEPPRPTITDDDRAAFIKQARECYQKEVDKDDGSLGRTLITVTSINGLASIAESQGNAEEAKALYERSAARAEKFYPALAAECRERGAAVDAGLSYVMFPSAETVARLKSAVPTPQAAPTIEKWLIDLAAPSQSQVSKPAAIS